LAKFSFKDLIIGKQVVGSGSEFKRLMLTGYLSLICISVAVIYTILDVSNEVYYSLGAYAILFIMPILSIWMIRTSHFKAAKISLMLSANLVVFWTALNDPFETGAFLFFIPTGIGSFAILAFDDHITGMVLAILTSVLFLLAYFSDLQPFPVTRPSEEYIRISFILNYFISLTISVLAVYFLMNLNRISEMDLIEKENFSNLKNAELRKVNEALDRFVYSVSHDLRSPLSSILGLTNLARLTSDPKELEDILKMIQGRVTVQDHFIREIIDYSRNARTVVHDEHVDLKKLVDEVVDSLKYNVHAEKIKFVKRIPENVTLFTDKIRLTIILSNLVGNSIKYHDPRKEDPYIEIGFSRDMNSVFVQDNGIGIMPEHKDKIFDMFYRGSDRSTGSGLGLFITKEAVTTIGGTIEVKSVYGEGSTFIIYLPSATGQGAD
jgi:signal transduction histidine kinase